MQHVTEAASLRRLRSRLLHAPALSLPGLARFDERIAAHLDGVCLAGAYGRAVARQALERAGPGEVFVAMVGAIENRDAADTDRLLAVAEALPAVRPGLLSALGWVPARSLQGMVNEWLSSGATPMRREVGLLACAMHGVDPGRALNAALDDADQNLHVTALRVAGRSGRLDLLPTVQAAIASANTAIRFEAARAALYLGDRDAAVATLAAIAIDAREVQRVAALALALKVVSGQRARTLLAPLMGEPAQVRMLIHHLAEAGDPQVLPWLIERMTAPALARVAGEAFAWITGLDLVGRRFHRRPPGDLPVDAAVDDPDVDLPWPDPAKIGAWWHDHRGRFIPGVRHFAGEAPATASCRRVLVTGFQRQRRAASEHLVLLNPGMPLFNTAAPAWRQRRLLAVAA